MSESLLDLLVSLEERPSGAVITDVESGVRVPHNEVPQLAYGVADELLRAGAGPGDAVGILAPNGIPYVAALFGAMATGAAAAPLAHPVFAMDQDKAAEQISTLVSKSAMSHVLTTAPFHKLCGLLAQRHPGLHVTDIESCAPVARRPTAHPVSHGDPAVVQFSSGSTTDPKGAVVSHGSFMVSIRDSARRCEMVPEDAMLQWMPLFHDYGLVCLLIALHATETVHLARPDLFIRRTASLMRFAADSGVTFLPGPNFAFDRLAVAAASGDLAGADFSRLRIAMNAAEPVSAATMARFAETFTPLGAPPDIQLPAYGMAEATCGITIQRPGTAPAVFPADRRSLTDGNTVRSAAEADAWRLVSQGRPLDSMRIRVVDQHGTALPEDRFGEIEARGPALMSGYLGDPDATSRAFHEDWLRTGDTGFLHGGELYVAGRIKDMITVHGRNVYAEDAEAAVRDIAGVYRRHCVAVADPRSEQIAVVVEADPTAGPSLADDVRRAAAATLDAPVSVHMAPRNSLPRTTSGKWRRAETRRMLQEGRL